MKSRFIKLVSIIVPISVMVTLLSACGASSNNNTSGTTVSNTSTTQGTSTTSAAKDSNGFDTSPVTLTVFADYPKVYPKLNWGDGDVTKYITEKTGVTLDVTYDDNGDGQKLKLMIASGDKLPDMIVTSANGTNDNLLYTQGCIQPLNKLADQYFPKFNELIPYQMKEIYQKDDGNLYSTVDWFGDTKRLATIKEGGSEADQTIMVNKKFYTELGSPKMDTLDEFKAVLKQFKQKHPEIPYPILFDSPLSVQFPKDAANEFYRLFGGADFIYTDQNNNIKFCYEDDKYKQALKYMNGLYLDKLISSDMLIINNDAKKEATKSAKLFAYIGQGANWMNNLTNGYSADTVAYAIEPPMAAGVSRDSLQEKDVNLGIGGWHGTFITKDCKNPSRAIQYLTFRYTDEMQMTERYGVEGKAWTKGPDGAPIPTQAVKDADAKGGDAPAVFERNNWDNSWFTTNWVVAIGTAQRYKDQPAFGQEQGIWSKYCKNERLIDLTKIISDPNMKVKADKFYKLWDETVTKLVLSKNDAEFEQTYAKFLKDAEAIGSKEIADYYTKNYAEWKKKLG